MDVKEFFFALAKECKEGKCEGCGAQDFLLHRTREHDRRSDRTND